MPKYDSERDKILDWLWGLNWANESDGDVNEYDKHFFRILIEEGDRQAIEDVIGGDMAACDPPVNFEDLLGSFVVIEYHSGLVEVREFAGNHFQCQQEYDALHAQYYDWLHSLDGQNPMDDAETMAGEASNPL